MLGLGKLNKMAKQDLTTGPVSKKILYLAIPIITAHTLQSLQSLIDMFFVGRLGSAAIAAVGIAGNVIMCIFPILMGINTATIAMISRATGSGDDARAGHVAGQVLSLAAIAALLLGAAGFATTNLIMGAFDVEQVVAEFGAGYLHIIFAGIIFFCGIFVLNGILQGAGDSVTPFYLGILTTACNLVLNPILIFGLLGLPALGVRGSALATVISWGISLTAGLIVLSRGKLRVRPRIKDLLPRPATYWKVVTLGIPSSMTMGLRSLMNLVLISIVTVFGTAAVAAYTIGSRIFMLGLFTSFGFAVSAATMVGQNLGAEKPERSKKSAFVATGMAIAVATVIGAVLFAVAPQLVWVFDHGPQVISIGAYYIRVVAVVLIIAPVGIVFSRSLNGAGDTVSPLIITLVTLWGFQIPAAIYLSGIEKVWGIAVPFTSALKCISMDSEVGIWWAMLAAATLQSALTFAWFMTGRWKHKRV